MREVENLTKKKTIVLVFFVNCLVSIFSGCTLKDLFTSEAELNEISVKSHLRSLVGWEVRYFRETGVYATKEQLLGENAIELQNHKGYSFELQSDGKSFQITAIPIKYGKTGKTSFYVDGKDGHVRGADHEGKPATVSDPILITWEGKMPHLQKVNRPAARQGESPR